MASAAQRSFGAQWLLVAVLTLVVLSAPALGRAERFESLAVGPELRTRELSGALSPPHYELSLPHGLRSAHGELVARLGLVLPAIDGASLAFPLTVGVRYLPFELTVRPLLGVDLGGYFTLDRGPASGAEAGAQASQGAEWTWSARALAGAQLLLSPHAALRLYGDAQWSELPEAPHGRALLKTGFGAGCELSFTFSAPRLALLDMLLHGTRAPEGW